MCRLISYESYVMGKPTGNRKLLWDVRLSSLQDSEMLDVFTAGSELWPDVGRLAFWGSPGPARCRASMLRCHWLFEFSLAQRFFQRRIQLECHGRSIPLFHGVSIRFEPGAWAGSWARCWAVTASCCCLALRLDRTWLLFRVLFCRAK